MNFTQLRDMARLFLDDTRSEKYLWSDSELGTFINQALREAAIRSRSIADSTTPDCSTINLSTSVSDYPLHESVFFVDRVYDSGQKKNLIKTTAKNLDNGSDDWPFHTGSPTHYILDANHFQEDYETYSIRVYPIPISNSVLNLTVYRSQLAELSGVDEPEIPKHNHLSLLHWVLHLAYMKQDADTFNAEKAIQFGNRFEQAFGQYQDARQLEWRRKHVPLRVAGAYL